MKIYVKGRSSKVYMIDTTNMHKTLNYSMLTRNTKNSIRAYGFAFNEDGNINCSILSRIFWWLS